MTLDLLTLLAREDKWYLANGRGAMYAPAFPRFLDVPGLWDECYVVDLRLERLFTVLILTGRDFSRSRDYTALRTGRSAPENACRRPISFTTMRRLWRPDRLTIEREANGLECSVER